MGKLIYKEEVYKIQGAVFEVYREMGCGFLEAVYQECLEIELGLMKIPFTPQKELPLVYKGNKLKQKYRPDLICFDKIVIEIKALEALQVRDESQILNYLNAGGKRPGLLVNFGSNPKVEIKRIIL